MPYSRTGCIPDAVFGAVSGFATKYGRSGERALPPMTKTPLTAPSARSNSLDNIDGGPERGVYTQMRGVEQVRIGCCFQRRRGASRIPLIAAQQVGQNLT